MGACENEVMPQRLMRGLSAIVIGGLLFLTRMESPRGQAMQGPRCFLERIGGEVRMHEEAHMESGCPSRLPRAWSRALK
jgi:hypothetical protein